jgi:hypothetical protein
MYWYELVGTLLATWWYKKPQNGTYLLVLPPVIPRSVLTGMYWYVLPCTCTLQGGKRWYKVVHDSISNGIWRYMEVHGSTRIC